MNEVEHHPSRYRELLDDMGFSTEDAQLLARLGEHARPEFERMACTFYARGRYHDGAHGVFESQAQIERLRCSLANWLEGLLAGPYDLELCARTTAIGRVHAKLGLSRYDLFGAMSGIRLELQRMAFTHMPEEAERVCEAIGRILDAELAILSDGVLVAHDVAGAREAEAQLRRTEKLAAVGTLAAGLAHEIRNPLNGAQLHLTFLRRTLGKNGAAEELLAAADVVSGEIKRLGDLVSEFLEFARPQPLHHEPTSIEELCRRSLDLVADVAQVAGVELVARLPATPVVADVDGAKIEQVLLNLLRNAIEAMSAGGTVVLSAVRRPRHALIEVEDSGVGVAADAPIWDAFYSTKEDGTGLGLAIAHRIVSDHGGAISVDSRPGRTVFRVELPLGDLRPELAQGGVS